MSSITSGNAAQYGNSEKLAARARLHKDYTVAETGWFEWLAQKMPFQPSDRVLDIGCGPGWFWAAVAGGDAACPQILAYRASPRTPASHPSMARLRGTPQ
jgi:tRNA G46 methylase TrmB